MIVELTSACVVDSENVFGGVCVCCFPGCLWFENVLANEGGAGCEGECFGEDDACAEAGERSWSGEDDDGGEVGGCESVTGEALFDCFFEVFDV